MVQIHVFVVILVGICSKEVGQSKEKFKILEMKGRKRRLVLRWKKNGFNEVVA